MKENHLYLHQLKHKKCRLKQGIAIHLLFHLIAYVGVLTGIIIIAGACEDISGFTPFQTLTIGASGLFIFVLSVAGVYYTEHLLKCAKRNLSVTQRVIAKRKANLT